MSDSKESINLETIKKNYDHIFVIVSPPRCSSTALARVFWEHPEISFYSHEPFDFVYYRDSGLSEVYQNLTRPIKLKDKGRNLLIKEMTFQVGEHMDVLAKLSSHPLIFNMRDPRLSIMSRLRKKGKSQALKPILLLNRVGPRYLVRSPIASGAGFPICCWSPPCIGMRRNGCSGPCFRN